MQTDQLFKLVIERYSKCHSYEDRGRVEFDGPNGLRDSISFQTRFRRPNQFRFEWKRDSSDQLNAVWWDKEKAYICMDDNKPEEENSRELAIAGATGVTARAVVQIPSLLIPEIRSRIPNISNLTDRRWAESVLVDNCTCHALLGWVGHDRYRLLVSEGDWSIRAIEEELVLTAKEAQYYDELIRTYGKKQGLDEDLLPKPQAQYEALHLLNNYFYDEIRFA
jgi:hypothetical protein